MGLVLLFNEICYEMTPSAHQRHERVPDRNLNDRRPPCNDERGPPKMLTYDGKLD